MAWIYLAESEDSASPYRRGLGRSPTAKSIGTPKVCSSVAYPAASLTAPLSTLTSEVLRARCSQESTSWPEASRARTSALQEMESAWLASEADYFSRSHASLARYDQASSSWKMFLPFGPVGPTLSSGDWPASGMTVAGVCYPLSMWERRTSGKDGGCSRTAPIPTATATDAKSSRNATAKRSSDSKHNAGTTLTDYVTMFPTPSTIDSGSRFNRSPSKGAAIRPTLGAMAKFDLWPTPQARDGRGPPGKNFNTTNLRREVGGQLNPTWVEWLMGYPLEWTALEDWAMQWFRPKRGKRSAGLVG